MRTFTKNFSVALVVFILSVVAVYAATALGVGSYDSNDFDIAIWSNNSTLTNHTDSMANDAVVEDSWVLEVTSSGGTLEFEIQDITAEYFGQEFTGSMTALSVDFDGDGDFSNATDAIFSGDYVSLEIPASELTAEEHLYPAQVTNSLNEIPMSNNVEFYINVTGCE
jgi:hypothetical protein